MLENFPHFAVFVLSRRVSEAPRMYQPGIGPHAENAAIALALATFTIRRPSGPGGSSFRIPASLGRSAMRVGQPSEWVVEIKMARLRGDNGKPMIPRSRTITVQ
jgi:hypothetical protein